MASLNDPRRVIGNIIQVGTIETVDRGEATCTVRVGEIVTGSVPWIVPRAGKTRIWSPPTVGEQCTLLCPEGDMEAGFAFLGLFSDANPAPSAEDIDLIRFGDGAIVSYDATAHLLVADLPAGGKVRINAPGGVTITGPLTVDGDVSINGKATASDDVIGGGKSLKGHIHTKVQAGGAVSGPPQ
ncbi:phage baseplate assembly protein V [Sphingomonas sp. SORGH_AS870]|uniref:phage baseplate assembly protein V n=1 Tax=Sphingomonas sp. SORGH_AS_0870 TaxID=3041801 RepID=UPI00285EAF6E|nr:phage baseplate assembly protein V [Sphingomonas sp. SORGH_AS_0870]MDR6144957.1 phage baseplate assembly protein V [Sphingomonas sp. SORGH_AS_0870]